MLIKFWFKKRIVKKIFQKKERKKITIITSSPLKETSGFLKCKSAEMAAIDAQSVIFPWSSNIWISVLTDQTLKILFNFI